MNGKELNEKKWKEIEPMIDEMIYQYQEQRRNDYVDYVKDCWGKLEKLLESYNLPNDTFKVLNVRYRKIIEDRMREIK